VSKVVHARVHDGGDGNHSPGWVHVYVGRENAGKEYDLIPTETYRALVGALRLADGCLSGRFGSEESEAEASTAVYDALALLREADTGEGT
jgi:hypothetical protein